MSVPDLDAALALHGLTVADVPGLEEAWTETFALLADAPVETVDDIAREVLGVLTVARPRGGPDLMWAPQVPQCNDDLADAPGPGLRPVLVISTRQGGGNREHEHDEVEDAGQGFVEGCSECSNEALAAHPRYLCDFDDDYDYTYAWHVFTVPGEVRARLLAAMANRPVASRRNAAATLADRIMSEALTPWSLLASRDAVAGLERQASQNRPGGEYNVGRNASEVDRLTRHLAVLDGLMPAAPRDSTESGLAETGVKGRTEETDRAMVARARVATLANPDLFGWLFAVTSAGMDSYTVGTGRQKRIVRYEKFDRGPLAAVEDRLSRSTYGARAAERRDVLVAELDAATGRVADEERKTTWTASILPVLRWRLGWPGEPDGCPVFVAPPVVEASSFDDLLEGF